jgi:hypothetical protein
MCKILGAQHSFKRRSQKTRPTSVRDIGDKAPFDKAPLEIRCQKKKRHVIDRKKKKKGRNTMVSSINLTSRKRKKKKKT